MNNSTYQKHLNSIFNRPISDPAWYWTDSDVIFENDLAVFNFIETLMNNIQTDLHPFSDDQIALGLGYIFNNSLSDLSLQFKTAEVSKERKVKALHSLFLMFRDICNLRCTPQLSSGSQVLHSKLNNFCYMFWDVTPLSNWIEINDTAALMQLAMANLDIDSMDIPDSVKELMQKQMPFPDTPIKSPMEMLAAMQQSYQSMDEVSKHYYQTIAEVMQQCLYLSNPSCVESGIHGLGHLSEVLPDIAYPILDRFIESGTCDNKSLLQYAHAARTSRIQ